MIHYTHNSYICVYSHNFAGFDVADVNHNSCYVVLRQDTLISNNVLFVVLEYWAILSTARMFLYNTLPCKIVPSQCIHHRHPRYCKGR